MDKVITRLKGHSGSFVFLMEDYKRDRLYVRKITNVSRNVERLEILNEFGYPVPKIYDVKGEVLDMEFIRGLDMKNYLLHNNPSQLYEFLCELIDSFKETVTEYKDYTETYHQKLAWLPDNFLFTKDELIERLPKLVPSSFYHGDLTLENILYTDPGFHLIDPVTIEYDSYIFDIAKLRQDLDCRWFIRNEKIYLDSELQVLSDKLNESYPGVFDDNILILMLLRVLKHCKPNDTNYNFLMKEIERLWK